MLLSQEKTIKVIETQVKEIVPWYKENFKIDNLHTVVQIPLGDTAGHMTTIYDRPVIGLQLEESKMKAHKIAEACARTKMGYEEILKDFPSLLWSGDPLVGSGIYSNGIIVVTTGCKCSIEKAFSTDIARAMQVAFKEELRLRVASQGNSAVA